MGTGSRASEGCRISCLLKRPPRLHCTGVVSWFGRMASVGQGAATTA
jgi:hypothetical protein